MLSTILAPLTQHIVSDSAFSKYNCVLFLTKVSFFLFQHVPTTAKLRFSKETRGLMSRPPFPHFSPCLILFFPSIRCFCPFITSLSSNSSHSFHIYGNVWVEKGEEKAMSQFHQASPPTPIFTIGFMYIYCV